MIEGFFRLSVVLVILGIYAFNVYIVYWANDPMQSFVVAFFITVVTIVALIVIGLVVLWVIDGFTGT